MQKLLFIGMTLWMMSSCMKHAQIYVKLSDEDAALIPYHEDQTVKFLNQNGDTMTYQVTRDITYPYNDAQYSNAVWGGDVIYPDPYMYPDHLYCYARTVVLRSELPNAQMLGFTIRPERDFSFFCSDGTQLDMTLWPTAPYTIDGIDYEDVHHEILYSHYTGELLYDWYYNEEFGLLYFTKGDISLTRIP